MRQILQLLLLIVAVVSADAAAPLTTSSAPSPQSNATSKSGQFNSIGPSFAITLSTLQNARPATNIVRQSPMEIVMTAERVKLAVLHQLNVGDQWESPVRLVINPRMAADANILMAAGRYANGWTYTLEMPVLVDRNKLIRALVQVVLQEIAQRGGAPATQIPEWLRDGMVALVMVDSVGDLVMEASPSSRSGNGQMWVVEGAVKTQVRSDPLSAVRGRLRGKALPTFWDLTQPPSVRRNDEARLLYESCAQVLVVELLKLEGGQSAMFKTLRELPHYLNWQLALLSGYNTQFKTMLDAEKWWSLISLNLESRDQYAKWTVDVTLTKLDEILRPAIAVKEGTSTVPQTRSLPLQQIIADMDFESQRNVLRQVVSRLNTLQWSVTPDLWKLVQDYQMVIETYLHRRGKPLAINRSAIGRQAASELDLLDVLRADFKRYGNGPTTAAAKP